MFGAYTWHVISCYGLAALSVAGLVIISLRQNARARQALRKLNDGSSL